MQFINAIDRYLLVAHRYLLRWLVFRYWVESFLTNRVVNFIGVK